VLGAAAGARTLLDAPCHHGASSSDAEGVLDGHGEGHVQRALGHWDVGVHLQVSQAAHSMGAREGVPSAYLSARGGRPAQQGKSKVPPARPSTTHAPTPTS